MIGVSASPFLANPSEYCAVPLNAITASWPLLLGMGVLMLGAGLQSTLLGVRATLEGFATPVIGIVMSMYYVGYLLGTTAAPRLLAKVGHVRVFAALAAVASAANLFQAAFVAPLSWGGMRLLSGLSFAGIYVVAESWLNAQATRATRGRLFAVYMVVLYFGLGAAQFLLVLSNPRTAGPFMLVSALISLALVPIALSDQPTPAVLVPQRVRLADLYHDSPFGVVGVAAAGVISSILFSIGPVYARLRGLDTTGVATYMGASIFGAVAAQYPIGALADRLDRRAVIAGVCVVATAVATTLAVFNDLPHVLFVSLAAVFSALVLTIYPLAVSHVNDRLEPAQIVQASSTLLLLNGSAAILGPTLATSVISVYGPAAYFAVLATITGALALYGLWRKIRRQPVPSSHKAPFVKAQPQC